MKKLKLIIATATVSTVLSAGFAFAQDHHDDHPADHHDQSGDHYVRHNDWHKGARINHDDWNRGQQVDWHQHHLRRPPAGYEWREVDGNYVLAAVATGVIASVIVASASH